MASFHNKTFKIYDDYMTPKSAWKNIIHLIPKNKKIWSPFYGDGTQKMHFKELGFDIIHENKDFFKYEPEYDIVIDNPPFSQSKKILERLVNLGKPFILILPVSKISTQYFRRIFSKNDNNIQLIIPRKRIQFKKMKVENGIFKDIEGWRGNRCNFDCFYYCWKMNLPKDIIWLE